MDEAEKVARIMYPSFDYFTIDSQNNILKGARAAIAAMPASASGCSGNQLDGNRSLPFDRDDLGRMVREAWVRWARTRPNPKPSWLIPYEELDETDKDADRQIGECVARWVLTGDAARAAIAAMPAPNCDEWEIKWQRECMQKVAAQAEVARLREALEKIAALVNSVDNDPINDAIYIAEQALKQKDAADAR